MFLGLVAAVLASCHQVQKPSQSVIVESTASSQKLVSKFESAPAIFESSAVIGLKETVYSLFFRQGIFAGQDNVGDFRFRYQRWQVPLVMGAMLDFNDDYLHQFHNFLPVVSAYQTNYGDYTDFLKLLYKINNWDVFPMKQQSAICKISGYCLIIDDRLWWVNFFLSYAENLYHNESDNQIADKLTEYAYKIFVSISRKRYLNMKGTSGSYSLMWYSGINEVPYYKSTIANSLYVTAGARLSQLLKNRYGADDHRFKYKLILKNTLKVADGYFLTYSDNPHNKLKQDGLLLDGVGSGGKNPHDFKAGYVVNYMFTYNQGVVLPGMLILSKLTGDLKYASYAKKLLIATINYSDSHAGVWDDYGYRSKDGWFADYDGIAFRLAYWQYLGMYLSYLKNESDPQLLSQLTGFIQKNAKALQLRKISLANYGIGSAESSLVSPNHNDCTKLPAGEPFSAYPDGYSLPGIAAALQLILLASRR